MFNTCALLAATLSNSNCRSLLFYQVDGFDAAVNATVDVVARALDLILRLGISPYPRSFEVERETHLIHKRVCFSILFSRVAVVVGRGWKHYF